MRKILKLNALILMLFYSCVVNANERDADIYRNHDLGVIVEKPAGWVYITKTKIKNALKDMQYESQEYKQYVLKYRGPFIAFKKELDGNTPAVVKLSVGYVSKRDSKKHLLNTMQQIVSSLKKNIGTLKVIKEPYLVKKDQHDGSHVIVKGAVTYNNGVKLHFITRSWLFLKDKKEFQLTITGPANETDDLRKEYREIYDSFEMS